MGMAYHCKSLSCYGKEYNSRKEFVRDFGIENKYNKVISLLNQGLSPETVIEEILDSIEIKQKKQECKNQISETVQISEPVSETDRNVPIYFTVYSIEQLTNELKNIKAQNINLIDFENLVHNFDILRPELVKDNTVNIFFYNACIYSNDFFKIAKCTNNINLQVLTYECANQLVDHLITFYLGSLVSAFPDKNYNIISKDTGFYHFVNNLNISKIKIIGLDNYIKNPEDRYRYSLSKYIVSNHILEKRNIIKREEFKDVFAGFFKKEIINNVKIDDLIKNLIKFNIVEKVENGFNWYKFNLQTAKDFIEMHA